MADQRLVNQARQLRRNSTEAERRLWSKLSSMRLGGVKFRRQHPIGHCIVDFVSLESKLVIEIDGGQHNDSNVEKQDELRTAWLTSEGYRVLRFWNNNVLNNSEGVIISIKEAVAAGSPSSSPSPLKGEGIKRNSPLPLRERNKVRGSSLL